MPAIPHRLRYRVTTNEGNTLDVEVEVRGTRDVNRAISIGFRAARDEACDRLDMKIGEPYEPTSEHLSKIEFWEVLS
jgi:hypothetical protein